MPGAFRAEFVDKGVLKIIFNLPDSRVNLFNQSVVEELNQLMDELEKNEAIQIAFFISGKENTFIAGADVHEIFAIQSPEDGYRKSRAGQQLFDRWEALPFPTVAVINGACLGGGTEFILSFNYRIATDNPRTQIGLPEVKLGIIPGWGGTQRLPRLIGLPDALRMITSGNAVSTSKAYRTGLVDEVIPHQNYSDLALALVQKILQDGGEVYRKRREKKPLGEKLLESHKWGRDFILKKARKEVVKQTRGHYPAPMKAIEAVEYGLEHGFQDGLEFEARQLGELAASEISKNLVQLFFDTEKAKKGEEYFTRGQKTLPIRKIAIIGAGAMGGGIAQLAAYHDHPVRIKDVNEGALLKALDYANRLFGELIKKRKLTPRQAELKMDRISTTLDYSGFATADLIIEAVVEDEAVKKTVFKELQGVVHREALVVSNTSSIPISRLAKYSRIPGRFAGFHFFNPVHRMPLIEIIRGERTSEKTLASLFELAKSWGKIPLIVKDGPGFLVNRLLLPYLTGAGYLLQKGVAIEVIDRAMLNFGMPMGPFQLLDNVGIDVAFKAAQIMRSYFLDRIPDLTLMERMVEKGRLGKKSGAGFYEMNSKKKRVDKKVYRELGLRPQAIMPEEEIQQRLIYPMINEAAICLQEGIVTAPWMVDIGLIYGIGFPAFRGGLLRYADKVGVRDVYNVLKQLSEKEGVHYQPASVLEQMANEGKGFYDFHKQQSGD